MKVVKIFFSDFCPKCPAAKELGKVLEERGLIIEKHDINKIEDMAEALYFNVLSTPSVLVLEEKKEIASWRGSVPDIAELEKYL